MVDLVRLLRANRVAIRAALTYRSFRFSCVRTSRADTEAESVSGQLQKRYRFAAYHVPKNSIQLDPDPVHDDCSDYGNAGRDEQKNSKGEPAIVTIRMCLLD